MMVPSIRTQAALALCAVFLIFLAGFALQPTYTVVSDQKTNFSTTKGTFSEIRIGSDATYFRGYVYNPTREVIGFKNFKLEGHFGNLLMEGTNFTTQETTFIQQFNGTKYAVANADDVVRINQSNPFWPINPLANYSFLFILSWVTLLVATAAFILRIPRPIEPKFLLALALLFSLALFLSLSRPAVFGDEAFILTDYTTALNQPTPPLLDASGHADLFFYPLYAPFFTVFGPINGLRIAAALFMILAALATYALLAEVLGEKRKGVAALLLTLPLFVVFASDPVGQSGLGLLFSSLFFIALIRSQKDPTYLVFAAVFAGAAARTYPILMAIPVFLVLGTALFSRKNLATKEFLCAIGIIGLFLLPVAAFHLTHDPFLSQGYLASKSDVLLHIRAFFSHPSLATFLSTAAAYAQSTAGALMNFVRTFLYSTTNVPQLFSALAAAGIALAVWTLRTRWADRKIWVAAWIFGFLPLTIVRPENTLSLSFLLIFIPTIVLAAQGLQSAGRTAILLLSALSLLQLALVVPALYHPSDSTSSQVTDWVKQNYLDAGNGTVFLASAWDKSFFYDVRENPRIVTVDDYYYTLYPRIPMDRLDATAKSGDWYVSMGPAAINRTRQVHTIGKAMIYAFT